MNERERQLVEDLVTKARASDPEAFTRLVERYSPGLRRFVRCLVGNPHDAQDVLQDAWLEAWRSLGRYRDGAAFRTWLFGIAKNRVNRLRRGKRLLMPLDEANELAAPNNIREEVQSKVEEKRLRQYLARLRPQEREIVELRCFENMSCKEIETVTMSSIGTVHSRMSRAKRRLSGWVGYCNIGQRVDSSGESEIVLTTGECLSYSYFMRRTENVGWAQSEA